MNRTECKKYLNRAYKNLTYRGIEINIENVETEIKNEMNREYKFIIPYCKVAINTLKNSATKITGKQLMNEIDVIARLYKLEQVIDVAKKLEKN